MAKSFSKRWQNGEISNFQYLMHLNTLAGRGYSDLTQYPVFPWVLADYESEVLDLTNPKTFRKLNKPMGCQTLEGEEEFKKRYESWDDPDVPKFHYGSHYSSAGIVLFYLLRLPPFSTENKTLQGGQFDHADRLFNSIRDTWLSAAGKGNTSDVKELIPEFFYMPEFLENRFNLDLGVKQSGEKVKWGSDLQSEHERYITEETFAGRPVIIRDYPKDIKAFYMRQNDDGKTVAAMDLLVPRVGELIGGSQREERLEYLENRLDELNLDKESYWWYLDLRRYGSGNMKL